MISYELVSMCQSYLDKKITLQQLERWLVPLLPSFERQSMSSNAELAVTMDHGLAEISDRVISEEDFRDELKMELSKYSPQQLNIRFGSTRSRVLTLISSASWSGYLPEQNNIKITSAGGELEPV